MLRNRIYAAQICQVLKILVVFICCSCRNDSKSRKVKNELEWDVITIKTGNKSYTIRDKYDTIFLKRWDVKDSLLEKDRISIPINVNLEKKTVYLDSIQKDSLGKIVFNILTKPAFPKRNVTCYVGEFHIFLHSGRTELNCNYYSIGEWRYISKDTEGLYLFLMKNGAEDW